MQEHEPQTNSGRAAAPAALLGALALSLGATACGSGESGTSGPAQPTGNSSGSAPERPAPVEAELGPGPFGALHLVAEAPGEAPAQTQAEREQLEQLLEYDHREHRPQVRSLLRRMALDPQDARLRAEFGGLLHGIGLAELAEPELLRALALDPDLSLPHLLLGEIYWSRGWHGRALHHLERSVALAPGVTDAYVLAGYVLREANEVEAGVRVAEAGLEVDRDHPGLLVLRAYMHVDQDEFEQARGLLERAVRRDADSERAHLLLSQVYNFLDLEELALEFERRHERLVVLSNAGVFRAGREFEEWERAAILASQHRATGRADLAREELDRSYALAPDNHAARVVEAYLVWDQGQWDEAIERARAVVSEDVRHTRGLRALAHFQLERHLAGAEADLDEAVVAARQASAVAGRTERLSLELLARVLDARGESEASQNVWRDLLLVDPQHPGARAALGLSD